MKRKRVPCEHGRQRSLCKDCGGSGICEHGRRRSRCRDCGGASICEHRRVRTQCTDCRFARAAADAQEKAAAALEKAAAALGGCGRTGERDGSASASGCTGGDAGVWRVYLCALLLVLNHAILNKSTRGRRGTVGPPVRWFVILLGVAPQCVNTLMILCMRQTRQAKVFAG